VHIEEGVRAAQAPPRLRTPLRREFHSGCARYQAISELRRNEKVSRRRIGFDDIECDQVFAEEVAIMVVKAIDVDRKPRTCKAAIAELVAVQLLRPERRICAEARENRQPFDASPRKLERLKSRSTSAGVRNACVYAAQIVCVADGVYKSRALGSARTPV